MTDNQSHRITPAQFITKWSQSTLSERAASQEHFIDLCRLLGQPTPAEHDATGAEYTFEKGVAVTSAASAGSKGAHGFADVWWRGKFAWEYKRKGKYRNLSEAYRQLCQYREALDNPPLLIVSDITHTEIHTNFTGTAKRIHVIELADIGEPESLDLLRRVFTNPQSFEPTITAEVVTREVAKQFATLANALRDRDHDPHDAAHFLMKCMFCLFAEDVGLLPDKLFERLLISRKKDPTRLTTAMSDLFREMKTGGSFGVDDIPYFNGGLFADAPALELTTTEIDVLIVAAKQDWASVEPAIFGTLFERSLDPNTRAQIGAHYTSREDIMLVIEPVIMAPIRREWEDVKAEVEKQIARRRKVKTKKRDADKAIAKALDGFVHRLASLRILDPACGSGNFLYVAIQQLLGLEKEVITYAARGEIALGLFPQVRPTQLLGIEINSYAAELAQVAIWIGYLQWMRDNGFNAPRDPILEPLQTIECRDAILDLSDPDNPKPSKWPEADFIIGNPPFLGGQLLISGPKAGKTKTQREGLGETYTAQLRAVYDLPHTSDLCCYWFERARQLNVSAKRFNTRIGLLATQAIRGQANREVLKRIKRDGDVFHAWSDRNWILDGAAVHVSIVCFDNGTESDRQLDGENVRSIEENLNTGIATTSAAQLSEMDSISYQGPVKVGRFEIMVELANTMLCDSNPHGESNRNVIFPYITGAEIADRNQGEWIIDFRDYNLAEASLYAMPFRHIQSVVKPKRDGNRNKRRREKWWLHGASGKVLKAALNLIPRYILCSRHAKNWIFRFATHGTFPDSGVVAFARSDDYFFGVLHSSIHELWARRMGTQLREAESGFRYTPTSCFQTFPFPCPPNSEPTQHDAYVRIAEAAKELNEQRERWLNPPEWIDPIAAAVDAEDDFSDVPEDARTMIRHSAIMARAAKDAKLKKHTLTNLYNERPTWLKLSHDKLDRAVLAAYIAVDPDGDWTEDWAEVWNDTGAGFPLPDDHALSARRKEVDQLVLANLLRLNLERTS